ncbi:MAG TPA: glycosyltransferase [Thermoanaerobaculaceae bacterium]|nr:glycosyltransferase [Thermoanaerobaculaceae bacterium]
MRSTLTADCDHLSPLAAFLENIPGLHLFNSLANVREVAVFGHGARRVLATRRLFTVSQFLREQIRHRLSLEASVIYPIWGLEDYRVASQKPVTGAIGFYAGGVPRAKGDEIVLAAARLLPDTRFLVVGSTLYRGSYDLPNNIFELGRLRDMRSFYSQIDLLLAPSIEPEGFPRVVVEAAFNGIPSIASRAGGLPEAVGDGGVLLPIAAESESEMHASGRSVAEAIRGLLASPDRLLELGSLARSHAERLRQLRDLQLWERAGVVSSPQASGK